MEIYTANIHFKWKIEGKTDKDLSYVQLPSSAGLSENRRPLYFASSSASLSMVVRFLGKLLPLSKN